MTPMPAAPSWKRAASPPCRCSISAGRSACPAGDTAETRFQTFHVAEPPAPGLRLFACQHLTPEATWVPGLMDHANTAEGLDAHRGAGGRPRRRGGRRSARLLDRAPAAEPDGALRLETGAAALVFLTAAQLAARYPGLDLGGLPEEGPVTLAIRVADRAAAARCVAGAGAIEGAAWDRGAAGGGAWDHPGLSLTGLHAVPGPGHFALQQTKEPVMELTRRQALAGAGGMAMGGLLPGLALGQTSPGPRSAAAP